MNLELKQNIIKALDAGRRLDGRKPDEYRRIRLECGVALNAEGSARVKMGNTEVIAGVKMTVEAPFPDTPDEGTIMVGAELLPLSNPDFELGPPGIQAIELARVVDRGIRESKTLDTKQLCVEAGEKVWIVMIDICTINDDGNLIDTSALATMAALKDTKFPKYEDGVIDYKVKTDKKLPLSVDPVAVTVLRIGKHFIVDPTPEEEEVIDARLTVASFDGSVCAMQKGGDAPLTLEEVDKMIGIALEKSSMLGKHLGG